MEYESEKIFENTATSQMRKFCFCLSCVDRVLNYSLQQRHGPLGSLMLTCDLHNPGMQKLAAKVETNPFTEKRPQWN